MSSDPKVQGSIPEGGYVILRLVVFTVNKKLTVSEMMARADFDA